MDITTTLKQITALSIQDRIRLVQAILEVLQPNKTISTLQTLRGRN